jgi:hypothetical protein
MQAFVDFKSIRFNPLEIKSAASPPFQKGRREGANSRTGVKQTAATPCRLAKQPGHKPGRSRGCEKLAKLRFSDCVGGFGNPQP